MSAGQRNGPACVGAQPSRYQYTRVKDSSPADCPRFERCSCPICPLDPQWSERTLLRGEQTCGLLLELSKPQGSALLRGYVAKAVISRLRQVAPAMVASHGTTRRAVRRAAANGSKLAAGRKLAAGIGASHV